MRTFRLTAGALAAALLLSQTHRANSQTQPAQPVRQTIMVGMRDGVHLATDVYLPPGKGPFPAVLARTPYNKDAGLGLAPQFALRGYAFVIQDSRGRFASEGKNVAYEADGWADGLGDGYDTVEWVAKQSWCNGKVGTTGGSALGIAQYLMAGSAPPHLVAQHIVVGASSMYRDIVYRGGDFKKSLIEEWLKGQKFPDIQLQTWLAHPTEDAFWLARDISTRWGSVNAAAVHVGGWYDIFTQSVLDSFTGYQTKGGPRAKGNQRLVLGPWTHGVYQQKAGVLTFPPNAAAPPDRIGDQVRWYDHWLKGLDNGVEREQAVVYYVMGDTTDPHAPGNFWRTASTWPPTANETSWYLHQDKSLSTTPNAPSGYLEYAYDPANPVPTTGGNHLSLPSGPLDQKAVEERPDVLVFSSALLQKPLEVTGRIRVKLWVSSDAPDTDFTAKLCDVAPDGRSLNICDGILRARFRKSLSKPELMQPGKVYPVEIDLWSTSMVFNKGHRLRVQISSSNAPAYDPNPNTGAQLRADSRTQIAHNRIYLDAKRPSQIVLPIPINEK